jgi:TRAP-type C4-dicarboxylate transport system permease small subunit
VLLLAGWAALTPQPMAWVYLAVVGGFELWLARRIAALGNDPVAAGAPPYGFTEDEARLVRRYRFYFTYPLAARDASSALAAVGLSGLVLALWLTFKQAFLPALLIGCNLFAVARLTKLLAPLMSLRIAASRGDRDALLMLGSHAPAWAKIRAGNEAESKMQG